LNPIISEVLANKYCEDCILSKRGKLIAVRDKTLEINQHYVPSSIKTLFVAESPPTKFYEKQDQYFYASGPIRYGMFVYNTMSVLFKEEMRNYKNYNKEYFLNKFREAGFYLIDMVKCPINKLTEE
jgi:hypothetical protein